MSEPVVARVVFRGDGIGVHLCEETLELGKHGFDVHFLG